MPLSCAERLLAPYPHGPVSVTFERLSARLVLGVDLRHELVEVELAKGVTRAEPHRLRGVALSPRGFLADHDPGRSVRVEPIDAVDTGRADRLIRHVDHPPHVVLRFADLLEEVELLLERDRHAPIEVARDLRVREPPHEGLRVVLTPRSERDLVAA